MPTDGIVRETAMKVTKRAQTDVDKARAIYEWVVANTERNPRRVAAAKATSRRCWRRRR